VNEVRFGIDVRCPSSHAFHVFTERIDEWWPSSHRRIPGSTLGLVPGPGGELVERGTDGKELALGRVTHWDPPRAITFAWLLGAPPDAPTTVTVTFDEVGGRTRVSVHHREGPRPLPDWSRTAPLFERGWNSILSSLDRALENP
jgi:uncharacterized protein YndB with AHSA1/START domain